MNTMKSMAYPLKQKPANRCSPRSNAPASACPRSATWTVCRQRRVPHVRGRGRRAAQPRSQLRLPGEPRHEDQDHSPRAVRAARPSSNCCSPTIRRLQLLACATAPASSSRWRANTTSPPPLRRLPTNTRPTRPARRWCAIRPNASSAANACACARKSRPSARSTSPPRQPRARRHRLRSGLERFELHLLRQCILACPTARCTNRATSSRSSRHSATEAFRHRPARPGHFRDACRGIA